MSNRDQLRLILGILAALILLIAGVMMTGIQSVAGNTIDEAFYNAMGWGSIGLGAFALLVAIPGTHPSDYPRSPASFKRCEECREVMRKDAQRCPHCGTPAVVGADGP